MLEAERKMHILNKLNESKSATIEELSQLLDVSSSTVRRDLTTMEESGLVKRIHGGAIINEGVKSNLSFNDKVSKNYQLKLAIAKKAASIVEDGQTIALNSSTITSLVAQELTAKRLTVVTNSLNILNILSDRHDYNVIVLGGVYVPSAQSIEGSITISQIKGLHFDSVFFGVNGIDLDFGISSTSEMDAAGKVAMIKRSNDSYVLCENLKFDRCSLFKITDLKNCSAVITDSLIDDKILERYRSKANILIGEVEE